ncbi:hypothetical protein ACVIHI_003457 [Bradyrhizobium sp. USDA 4524]|uniref:hypothetical protein n=1 Tax=unclassified Bradyrhizobium TaxID=2631580 RepID=UPI00209D2A9B|nr:MULTISPECIES: hypothetical protein [unclassified Bradyrhizobium]MCP1843625.1 hypothetical protein [Bradyrhizobium sp. USDA 4538]MCP1904191.1 hypothetical protein [Bradyrhizobium sp. USDA 4537]MCP1990153.1 hypothetical protein [Bradyrhizobium sp. USDA 4539]
MTQSTGEHDTAQIDEKMTRGRDNLSTLQFYERVEERCMFIATLPPSQHDAEIIKLCKETGLTPVTIAPVVEKYAHRRLPDYTGLAKQFIERLGLAHVHAMISTNHGMRELKAAVQTALADERLSLTGPRVALFIDAIKSSARGD